MEIDVFRETWTLTCKLFVKVTFFMKTWNDPTVITDILPQTISRTTPIEVQFLTKVLKRIFPKVWDSVWAAYSIIWYHSCGNFDENSIRTRSKRYEVSRKIRIFNKSWIYYMLLQFWSSAAEAAACNLFSSVWSCCTGPHECLAHY